MATVITHLVQDAPPPPAPPSALRLERWPDPVPALYRALFARVGGPWLWYSRLLMDDDELGAILNSPATSVWRLLNGNAAMGFVEVDAREASTPRIAFLGLVPELAGRGHGRWLLGEAAARAWASPGVRAVRVNTCTLDHPAALPNYLRGGFRVTGRSVETFPDPRLSGVLAAHLAPHAPPVFPAS